MRNSLAHVNAEEEVVMDAHQRDGQPPHTPGQPAGGDDLYSGPFLATGEQARKAAAWHQAQADAAEAALPAARAALHAVAVRLDALEDELARTPVWQNRERMRLREQIHEAENLAADHHQELCDLQDTSEWCALLRRLNTQAAEQLEHREQVQHAAGDTSVDSRPRRPSSTSAAAIRLLRGGVRGRAQPKPAQVQPPRVSPPLQSGPVLRP
jgi:hypothetical protein